MQIENLENHTNFLLSAALNKCGNLEEAQDLTQDALLAALDYISKGNIIKDMRGWLLTVLNRKFYQKLRKKYQIPIVTIGEDFDIMDEADCFANINQTDEAGQVRKAVAYLSGLHREVIVRYYMNGESVEKIAKALDIPQGTVKSRLSAGREQIKKELNNMENFEKQSYEPIKMWVSNSGNMGINGEPGSLVNDDLIAQNLLYLAYNEPVTEIELAKAIGIPTAYIEPIIKKLVDGELMKRVGNKVYTDFMISTPEDKSYIPEQKEFIEENKDLFFRSVKVGLEKIRNAEYYKRFNEHQRNALELYIMTDCLGAYWALSEIYPAEQSYKDFKDRPNGGKWLAFGHIQGEYKGDGYNYGYAGKRWTELENYFDSKKIMFYVYDLDGFPIKKYLREFDSGKFYEDEENVLKLLYMVESCTNPEGTGFNIELLKRIPWLVECGILRYEPDGKPVLDIPVMSTDEWDSFQKILWEITRGFKDDIKPSLAKFVTDKKKEIPKHLTSVPLIRQYAGACGIFTLAAIRLALKEKIINAEYDYDDDSDANARFPYAMVFVRDV